MKRLLLVPVLLLPLVSALDAKAQQQALVVQTCGAQALTVGGRGILYMDASGNLCSSASNVSVSASIVGFSNEVAGTPISATVGGAAGTLPLTNTVVVQNVGTFPAWCQEGGVSTGITTGKLLSASGGQWAIDRKTTTQIFCEGIGGTTTVNMQGGTGLAIDTGGGSGGSGGSGAITAPLGHATVDTAAVSVVPSATAAFPVTGTFWQATQPVSGTFWQATQPVSGTFWQATQPVSGTVTANAGTGSFTVAQATAANLKGTMTINQGGAALSVTNGIFDNILTGNAAVSVANPLMTEVVDSASHVAAVTAGGNLNVQCANCSGSGVSTSDGAAFAVGTSLFAGIGGEYSLSLPAAVLDGKQSMAAITTNRSLWTDWYNAAGTEMGTSGSPVQVSVANTAANGTAIKVDGTGGTFPVTGTVTANAGTNLNTSLLALETGGNLASVKTDVDSLNLAIASTTSGQKGNLNFGAVTTAAPTYTTGQTDPLSLTTAGGLRVDGTFWQTTQPVSIASMPSTPVTGTFWQATQPVSGTFWQATQPVSGTVTANAGSGTFTVSGTVTANAGTNLNTSLLATDAHLLAIEGTVSNGTAATNSALQGCVFNTSLPTLTTGQGAAVQCDNNARQIVNVGNTPTVTLGIGSNTIGALTANQSVNNTQVGGSTITTAASGTQMVGIEGHTGATVDASLVAATAPTNGVAVLEQYNSSAPTPTSGQTVALQSDSSGNLKVNVVAGPAGGTSATDAGTFTAGSSSHTPIGCEFTTGGATALVTGHMGTVGCTNARSLHVLDDNSAALLTAATAAIPAQSTDGVNIGGVEGLAQTGTAVVGYPVLVGGSDGTNARNLATDASGILKQGVVSWGAATVGAATAVGTEASGNVQTVNAHVSNQLAQNSTTSGQTGNLELGAVTTSSPSYTTAKSSPLSLDTSGNLRVNVVAGGASGGTSAADAASWVAATTAQTAIGCEYTSGGATALVTAHFGTVGCTTNRELLVNVDNTNANITPGDAVATGTYTVGSPTIGSTLLWNGTTYDRWKEGNATGVGAVSLASGAVASGAIASGAVASGAFASGSIGSGAVASGAIASGAVASGAFASGSISDGASVTLGVKADAKSTATDTTSVTIMQVLKEISALEQAPAALPANQSMNEAQVNGHTLVEATTAGVQKVGIVGNAGAAVDAATGAAPPANILYSGANGSGATGGHVAGLINCDNHVFKHITSATDTLAVQGVASQIVYICGWRSRAAGVATWFLENTASANANCSSANTQINGVATEAANTGEVLLSNYWQGLKNTVGNGLCINSTGTGGVDVDVWYAQF